MKKSELKELIRECINEAKGPNITLSRAEKTKVKKAYDALMSIGSIISAASSPSSKIATKVLDIEEFLEELMKK